MQRRPGFIYSSGSTHQDLLIRQDVLIDVGNCPDIRERLEQRGFKRQAAPALAADFDYRDLLPVLPFACLAAGLAFPRQEAGCPARSRVPAAAR